MKFLSSTMLLKDGGVKTSSWLRMIWLTALKGYRVEQIVQHPRGYMLGQVTYSKTWVLRAPRR